MMAPIAAFEKVSFDRWMTDQFILKIVAQTDLQDEEAMTFWREIYENIQLPVRATAGSAGYDFHMPYNVAFRAGQPMIVPTGIRCKIEPGWMLSQFPRSGLGFKHGMHLMNTVGIVDSDYYNAENEGHIMAKIDTSANFVCTEGERFIQGVLLPYGTAINDAPLSEERNGGFGSTGV